MLTDKKIKEFQKLYLEEFGEKISFDKAKKRAIEIIELYKIIYHPIPEMNSIYIDYFDADLQQWRSRKLIKKWKKQFPDLVEDHHFNSLINPSNKITDFTFYEYFTGFDFVKKGYRFIFEPYVENYLLQNYKSEELRVLKLKFLNAMKDVVGEEKFERLKVVCHDFKTGQPDLFIYKSDGSDYFFAECKSENDKLRPHQNKLINLIKKIVPVKIVYLIKK